MKHLLIALLALTLCSSVWCADPAPDALARSAEIAPICISGIYPHLTMWNRENECGTGAVVVWQKRLWAITYAPHKPSGSSDKLYEITPDLKQIILPGSVGGTPANRMIHRESNQLLIGPYVIDVNRNIRVIPPSKMYGRLTGTARHLFDPQHKVYYATMEEGLYEVDINTLDVKCLIRDGNGGAPKVGIISQLPGYHGKGLYAGQGRLLYANNGEHHPLVKTDPTISSGALAEWFGEADWRMVRRHQFTEITGPGGIHGNPDFDHDVVWTMGWDARSLVLGLLEDKRWTFYRLPKGSHSYDGSHGWNTEWPRIREIGETDLLATMHGTFWRFPKSFSRHNSSGIVPRSNYLKVIGDFCRWNDHVVFGCDDSAKAEFLNTRDFKAKHAAPLESNSNLWFVEPTQLDSLGPPIGRGSVWLRDDVTAGQISDPYLFSGYDYRQLHLTHQSKHAMTFALEVDRNGTDQWRELRQITVPPNEAVSHVFEQNEAAAWIRVISRQAGEAVTANFQYRNRDSRAKEDASQFAGIATGSRPAKSFGLMRSLAHDRLGIVASSFSDGRDAAYYELNQQMELVPKEIHDAGSQFVANVAQPAGAFTVDNASVVIVEDGQRYRLPMRVAASHIPTPLPAQQTKAGKSLSDHIRGNLARGARVQASSTHGNYSAQHVVDGDLTDDSRWIGAQDQKQNWIELDLGKEMSFGNVWVVTGWKNSTDYVARDFDVQVAVGDQWQTLPGGSIRGNAQVRREIVLDAAVTARRIRLTSTSSDYFRVYEIALFAKRPDIEETRGGKFGIARVCREVATERDLLNIDGTFYELPARNAQGLTKVRPITTHDLAIHDFCSHNGLLFITGVDADVTSKHIFRSSDGKAAVWAGVVDDLWKLGKPRGVGGPWKETSVNADAPSDPYLMTGYDRKTVSLQSDSPTTITAEIDVDGTGVWIPWKRWELSSGQSHKETFPTGFSAYWIRFRSSAATVATAQLRYE